MKYGLIVFDADGTLRECTVEGQPCPNREGEWELLPNVREKLSSFDWVGPGEGNGTGYGIASNQGGVGAGYFTGEMAMKLLKDTFREAFGFAPAPGTIQMCPHDPRGGCSCRKPNPEMLHNLMDTYGVPPEEVLFVGDREDDLRTAENAGCHFMWAHEFFGGGNG